MTKAFYASGIVDPAHQEVRMSHQQSFDFAREESASRNIDRRASEVEINRKLRKMQAMPESPKKEVLANEILQWILAR